MLTLFTFWEWTFPLVCRRDGAFPCMLYWDWSTALGRNPTFHTFKSQEVKKASKLISNAYVCTAINKGLPLVSLRSVARVGSERNGIILALTLPSRYIYAPEMAPLFGGPIKGGTKVETFLCYIAPQLKLQSWHIRWQACKDGPKRFKKEKKKSSLDHNQWVYLWKVSKILPVMQSK